MLAVIDVMLLEAEFVIAVCNNSNVCVQHMCSSCYNCEFGNDWLEIDAPGVVE